MKKIQEVSFTSQINEGQKKLLVRIHEKNFNFQLIEKFKHFIKNFDLSEINTVTIDMREVRQIDSSGIGVLITLHKIMLVDNGSMILENVQPEVMEVIKLLRLHYIFETEVKVQKKSPLPIVS